LQQRVAGPAEHRERGEEIAGSHAQFRRRLRMAAQDDDQRTGKRQARAQPLQPADMLDAERCRDQQHGDRR
jgi:hypothetical protein